MPMVAGRLVAASIENTLLDLDRAFLVRQGWGTGEPGLT